LRGDDEKAVIPAQAGIQVLVLNHRRIPELILYAPRNDLPGLRWRGDDALDG
jgi:hypothetical protein